MARPIQHDVVYFYFGIEQGSLKNMEKRIIFIKHNIIASFLQLMAQLRVFFDFKNSEEYAYCCGKDIITNWCETDHYLTKRRLQLCMLSIEKEGASGCFKEGSYDLSLLISCSESRNWHGISEIIRGF